MSLPWLRLYTEFASDPKIQILAFEDQRHYVMLLCLKGAGTLDAKAPSDSYRDRLIAKGLGLDPVSAIEAKRRLMEGGLIGEDWQPTAWENRQFKSDHDAAERKRIWREKQRHGTVERDSHKTVTTRSRKSRVLDSEQSQIQNRTDTEQIRGDARGEPRATRSAATRIPDPFELTDERKAYASAQSLDPARTLEDFRDYWTSASGAKARKHDWDATWRMWCRNQGDRKTQATKPRKTRFEELTEHLRGD